MAISKVVFRANTGNEYELQVEHEDYEYIPTLIIEEADSRIYDAGSAQSWDSLADMTQDLKVEISSWESDPGN